MAVAVLVCSTGVFQCFANEAAVARSQILEVRCLYNTQKPLLAKYLTDRVLKLPKADETKKIQNLLLQFHLQSTVNEMCVAGTDLVRSHLGKL